MTKRLHFLAGLLLVLCLLCTACGGTGETILSQNDSNEGPGGGFNEDTVNDFSSADGNWQLYLAGDVADEGYLRYEPEWGAVYAYSSLDDSGSRTEIQNGQLYITSFGYFNYGDGMEYYWYEGGEENDNGSSHDKRRLTEDDEADQWDAALYQHDVSAFAGVWYYDGDLSAETYIVIDGDGNWSYYQRAPGTEAAEMDCGTFSYSADEDSTYYADSDMYDGVSYKVFELDDDVLVWGDEGAYYLME